MAENTAHNPGANATTDPNDFLVTFQPYASGARYDRFDNVYKGIGFEMPRCDTPGLESSHGTDSAPGSGFLGGEPAIRFKSFEPNWQPVGPSEEDVWLASCSTLLDANNFNNEFAEDLNSEKTVQGKPYTVSWDDAVATSAFDQPSTTFSLFLIGTVALTHQCHLKIIPLKDLL